MAKKLVKKQDGGEPSRRQQRLTNRADKAFTKASTAQKELNRTYFKETDLGPVDAKNPFGPRMRSVSEEKVYNQPGYGKDAQKLARSIERNVNKVNRLTNKASQLSSRKQGGSVKKKK